MAGDEQVDHDDLRSDGGSVKSALDALELPIAVANLFDILH